MMESPTEMMANEMYMTGEMGQVAKTLYGEGYRFIAVRAILDLMAQKNEMAKVLNLSTSEASRMEPVILGFEIERQKARPGKDLWSGPWVKLDIQNSIDVLEKAAVHTVTLPEQWVPGTLQCQFQVYPSTLASLQQGLEGLLREPNGCFEQTSTSNYPNVLILDYLKETDQARPEVERRARDLLARGYQKLTSFECRVPAENRRQGYEWFAG